MDEILSDLAKSNINVLSIEYSDGEPQAVLFEYQWRMPNSGTKWTRAVMPWDPGSDFGTNLRMLRVLVKAIRVKLEG